MKLNYRSLLFFSFLVTVGATRAHADTNFTAMLSGLNESPPNASPATGSATMVLNNAQTELTYMLSFSGLTSAQTAAHFHNDDLANPSPNGGVVRGIGVGSPISGVWKNTDAQPLTPAMVVELFAGRIYINVHTSNFPAGEIRGNVIEQPVPVEAATWGRIKALYQ